MPVEGEMRYRELVVDEVDLIEQIDATNYIENVWRINADTGQYEWKRIDWTDYELPNGMEWHKKRFCGTLQDGGKVFGCFDQDTLVGYATVDAQVFGNRERYVLLDQLFVSKDYRGKGLGRQLVTLCCEQARLFGAKKLYLCAGSSENTLAFYKKLGFQPAAERNEELYAEDPNDIQLELVLNQLVE